jgi:hypothetical protein
MLFRSEQVKLERAKMSFYLEEQLKGAKNPIIIIGESHASRNSLLNTLLLMSICMLRKPPINICLTEATEGYLKETLVSLEKTMAKAMRYKTLKSFLVNDRKLLAACTLTLKHKDPTNCDAEQESRKYTAGIVSANLPFFTFFAMAIGVKNHQAIDPQQQLAHDDRQYVIDAKRELPMQQAIAAQSIKAPTFAIIGALHLPEIVDGLRKQGFHPIAFDFSNGAAASKFSHSTDGIQVRFKLLEEARASGSFYNSSLVDVNRQIQVGEAMALATESHLDAINNPAKTKLMGFVDNVSARNTRG